MNYGRVLLPLSLIVLAGCQKSALSEGSADTMEAASYCAGQLSKASSEDVRIVGKSATEAGSTVSYSLDQAGNCVSSSDVTWKVAGASRTKTSASGMTSTFKLAGTYVVTAQEKTSGSEDISLSLVTTVVKEDLKISGPQAGFVFNPMSFEVVIPSGVDAQSIVWNFNDGTATVSNARTVEHSFFNVGTYQVQATVTDADGKVTVASHRVTVMTVIDDMDCLEDLRISGANEAKVKIATMMHVYLPACLVNKVGAVRWNFGDGGTAANQSVTHAYQTVGTYAVTATLYLGDNQEPWVTLDHSIRVIEDLDVDPEPEVPVDPNACTVAGATRESQGELVSEEVACGVNGKKTVSYRDRVVEECKLVVEKLNWVEVSRTKEITNEGSCEGQSCKLPDGSLLAHGASQVLYSNSTPVGSCSSVSESRTCNNGVLSGSSTHNQVTCHEGCGSFGSHGTVKTGVITGETKVPLKCSFNEEGFFDLYNEISDQTCTDGQIISSNTRQGTMKEAGKCPVYKYAPTDNFTACTADCGGKQNRIFVCVDDKGVTVDDSRCADQVKPVEERLCDANPEAVRSQSSVTTIEEANSSATCPANQIGVIVKTREVVTTKTMACIDHSVQLESEVAVPGAWVEEKYCRDYVARRCSHDSLSNTEAKGRYDWMVKCQDELPVIKEFLTSFANVTVTVGGKKVGLGSSGQEIYATFMDRAYNPEKAWIAPKKANAPCTMPATAYVATVCVSSCATPEQQILAEEVVSKKLKYMSFFDALTSQSAYVGTMQSADSLNKNAVVKTKVDQWVTELVDGDHEILVFKMKSGRELRVTKNHPILSQDGSMKVAEEFKVGESLVQSGGTLDAIVSINEIKYFGKVYNVFVQSNAPHKNVVLINGYLNGSAFFQNAGAKEMNRTIFRNNMTRGVFGK
ncbi:PKD domain-containing protein [Bdellovibrio bacteriovorus]|uniref:Putative cell surface protein n=1 Tax=Bdellovibrio bacteriovorus (strain ATCC 15356 / DSM 50701 / NCIMB 9529 / HD100) TaxID=264462 RepID=Q6MKJ0_BDEBA|nr:PKD domain-containing protein [Bdellovibrio bacteriovorus]CAE80217.1 putative cell surface protein [Bdellovibrio bacteriovorus HD100]